MSQRFNFKFWNDPKRLYRESAHNRMRLRHSTPVPGHIGDHTDRGQPGRFSKWVELPDTAHRLFWRIRGMK